MLRAEQKEIFCIKDYMKNLQKNYREEERKKGEKLNIEGEKRSKCSRYFYGLTLFLFVFGQCGGKGLQQQRLHRQRQL